ncbi:MAG: IS66 family insertion sequence element accessory protein TnpB [Bacteroidales bacterium]|nr:IS66 family insertion sequence element accessory protein TnpB [Bacteroidales bacterium]
MHYYVCQHYVRMNLGINGLYKLVSQEMGISPLNGSVFIFFGKTRQQVKILHWDRDGFVLYQKRLEKGSFEMPCFNAKEKACRMSYKTLSAIMSGISLKSVRYRKRMIIENQT